MPGGQPAVWPLVFMAAALGGMMRAPVMAAVFAFELTGDANALLPLLAAAAVAYGFTVVFMRRSILTEKIARRGYHIYREYGIDPLERHFVDEVMTRTTETIDAKATVAEVLRDNFGAGQKYRAYPVVDAGILMGMADRKMLDQIPAEKADASIGTFFTHARPQIALPQESCRTVAARLAINGLDRVPVVHDEKTHRLLGIVSRHDLVKPSKMVFNEEHEVEQFRRGWTSSSTRLAPTSKRGNMPR
jgi:CBS domain-containing protein